MKLNYIQLIIALLIGVETHSQSLQKLSSIDSLSSSKEVELFIHSVDTNFKEFIVKDTAVYYHEKFRRIADSLHQKPWFKNDFDNNGYTDLLVLGLWSRNPTLLCIMSDSSDIQKIKWVFIPSSSEGLFIVPVLVKNETAIKLTRVQAFNAAILIDTHVYKYGGFVEYHTNASVHTIKKITVNTYHEDIFFPISMFKLTPKRFKGYFAKTPQSGKRHYKSEADSTTWAEITGLLNYIHFTELDAEYTRPVSNLGNTYITVYYDNGKRKKIKDYGFCGTFGLFLLRNKLLTLEKSGDWGRRMGW